MNTEVDHFSSPKLIDSPRNRHVMFADEIHPPVSPTNPPRPKKRRNRHPKHVSPLLSPPPRTEALALLLDKESAARIGVDVAEMERYAELLALHCAAERAERERHFAECEERRSRGRDSASVQSEAPEAEGDAVAAHTREAQTREETQTPRKGPAMGVSVMLRRIGWLIFGILLSVLVSRRLLIRHK